MRFDLKRPCAQCPYTRGDTAVRLPESRTASLISYALEEPGSTFPCHKTVRNEDVEEQFCAGLLLFAEKQQVETHMLRMAKVMRLYNPEDMSGHENVFDSAEEMMEKSL